MARETVHLPEVLFQFQTVGKSVRVVAIDPVSRTEVTMVAPSNATMDEVKRIAARKLAYVIAKNRRKAAENGTGV